MSCTYDIYIYRILSSGRQNDAHAHTRSAYSYSYNITCVYSASAYYYLCQYICTYMQYGVVSCEILTRSSCFLSVQTYTGSILVAVNPYKMYDMYGLDIVKKYEGQILGTLPP